MTYTTLRLDRDGRIATITIDAPPVNVITRDLFIDLLRCTQELEADDDITVVVLQSANPEFFLAHFDVGLLVATPLDDRIEPPEELNAFDTLCERFRTMPKVTICKINGRVGGGGSEIAMACDLRYGGLGRAVVNQMEVPIGIIPGGGGTQRLPRMIGWGRAAEIILGGVDLDAETGERWGYFDRAVDPAELDALVDGFARRVASFPPTAVRHAKASMLEGAEMDLLAGLMNESHHFDQVMQLPSARATMQRFLDLGGQTRDGELDVAETSARAAREAGE